MSEIDSRRTCRDWEVRTPTEINLWSSWRPLRGTWWLKTRKPLKNLQYLNCNCVDKVLTHIPSKFDFLNHTIPSLYQPVLETIQSKPKDVILNSASTLASTTDSKFHRCLLQSRSFTVGAMRREWGRRFVACHKLTHTHIHTHSLTLIRLSVLSLYTYM